MKKISTIHINKLWGYEKWIYSPLKKHQSTYENGSVVENGPLIKIICANDDLSIQVHPDDKLARSLENENNGKTECWFVLKAKKDQKVQVGLSNYNLHEIKKHIMNGTLNEILNYEHINVGDFINVPAGLVHGICGGTTVLEVQQPSDITYRLFDFNRKQKDGSLRELHIEKSLKSIKELTWNLKPISKNPLTWVNDAAQISFYKKPFIATKPGIIIDLKTYDTFECVENESIQFEQSIFVLKSW